MAEQSLKIQRFDGGIATVSEKADIENSAKFIKTLNIFEDPSYITLAKAASKVSGSTVDDLIHWMADGSPWDTSRYFYAANGKIFKETSGGTWSSERTVSGSAGEGFLVHDNYLYYAQSTDIGRYGPLDNSPSFTDAFTGWWLASDLETSGGGTGATDYSPGSSIDEGVTHRQTFTPDHDPIEKITIDVDVVGTGDWTVTVHDVNNRSIGSKTITNGSMSTGDVDFAFSSSLRVIPGEEYHFHVTTDDGTGGVDTSTNDDLEAAEFTVTFDALIDADFHMMSEMLGGWAIGNERYIGYFDNINGEYDPTKIALAPGFEVRNIFKQEEYLIAEAWKGQSFSETEEARRYYWDGIAETFNFFEELNMGVPNAAKAYRNNIIGVYGNRGSIYAGSRPFEKITDEVPKLARGKITEVYPGAISEYEERLIIGYTAVTDDGSNLEQGVYEFGSQSSATPNTLSFPYKISTGTTQGTTLKIGSVKAFGEDLYIGWRDNSTYGVDKVSAGDSAVAAGSWESRIFDAGDPESTKYAIKLEVAFETLATNETVTPKYKVNRAGSFTTGTAATSGDSSVDLFINSNFKEIEFGFDIASSDNTFVVITGVNFIYDDLGEGSETE